MDAGLLSVFPGLRTAPLPKPRRKIILPAMTSESSRQILRQDPRAGRFIEENFALFFMPACLSGPDGRAVYWNHHAERTTGISAAEALGTEAYPKLLDFEVGEPLLDLFLAGRGADIEKRYGAGHLLWDASGNLAVLDCPKPEEAWQNHRKTWPRLLLCGHWTDKPTGDAFTYLAWSRLKDYEFTKSPSLDLYRLLHGLDRKRPAWFGFLQNELYCYLSRDFLRAIFPPETSMEEIIGTGMAQTMTPAAAQDHARTLEALTPEQSLNTELNWPRMFRHEPRAWIRTYPNVLLVNGQRANFSLVQDVTAEKERDSTLENLLAAHRLSAKTSSAQQLLTSFAGRSQAIRDTLENLLRAALSLVTVAIYGETGTGKNLAAHLVHQLSSRSGGPFVSVNCGAIPEELFESIFFGHVKGAFTGAIADKDGLLTSADTGTLFLDEISELSPRAQAKLLQALSEKSFTPVGSTKALTSKFRLIAATNRDLKDMVRQGLFREDLFYRVNVIDIYLPPLRERREDIPLLAHGILQQHGLPLSLAPETLAALETHHWPGNIRELENVILRYAADRNLNFFHPMSGTGAPAAENSRHNGTTLKDRLAALERDILRQTLAEQRWNRNKTAEVLGISRVTLFRRMKELDLL